MAYVVGKEPFAPDLSKFKRQAEVRKETAEYLAGNEHFQDALNATADAIEAAKKAGYSCEVDVHRIVDQRVTAVLESLGYVVKRPIFRGERVKLTVLW